MAEREGITISLGPYEYRVTPQKLGRIERKLGAVLEAFGSGDAEQAAEVNAGTLHEAFQVFVPDVMPLWEFRGRMSADDDGTEEYDPARDHSPTVPELIQAIEAIFTVNGGDRLARFFGRFVEPKVLEATISARLAEWAATSSAPSQSEPPQNGGSASTTSMTRKPIEPAAEQTGGKIPIDPGSPSPGY